MEQLIRVAEAGQDLRALSLDGLKRARRESQQLQDRGSDLGRFHALACLASLGGARRVDDERNVPVARVVATVFGDLRAGRVDRADLRDAEHVRVVRVGERYAEEGG